MRVDFGDLRAHGLHVFRWIARRAQSPSPDSAMSHKTIGNVDLFAPGFRQGIFALMRHYPDHLHPYGFRSRGAREDPLSYRRFLREGLRSKKLVDDHSVTGGRVVVLGK